jgi:hypothetical protein
MEAATLLAFALIVIGPVAAIGAHELTHVITIWPVAENVTVRRKNRWRLETVYQLYDQQWRMRYADISNLSPSILGTLALVGFLLTNPFPIEFETLWVVPTWLVYTVGGSADYFFT